MIDTTKGEAENTTDPVTDTTKGNQTTPEPHKMAFQRIKRIRENRQAARQDRRTPDANGRVMKSSVRTTASRRSGDAGETDYSDPPPSPKGQDFIFVDFRSTIEQLSSIDTKELTAEVKISLIFYWTDTRLKGWEGGLPDDLWGPWFDCYEMTPDTSLYCRSFSLVDSAKGRLKRTVVMEGKVLNPMSLVAFPFDSNDLVIRFWTASTFKTLDESKGSTLARGRDYELRALPSKDRGEGKWLTQQFSKQIADFECPGISTKVNSDPPANGGQETSNFTMRIHLRRKYGFYVWKALIPTWLLGVFTFKTFFYPIDDLGNRDAFMITLLLATFAMMYVTENYLPMTDFLTCIDQVTLAVIFLQFFSGVSSSLLYLVYHHRPDFKSLLEVTDGCVAIFLSVAFLASQLYFLLPKYLDHRALIEADESRGLELLRGDFMFYPINLISPWVEVEQPRSDDCLLMTKEETSRSVSLDGNGNISFDFGDDHDDDGGKSKDV